MNSTTLANNSANLIIALDKLSSIPKYLQLSGGKATKLGDEINETLNVENVTTPGGFCVTTESFNRYFDETGLRIKLFKSMESVNRENFDEFNEVCKQNRKLILKTPLPSYLVEEVALWYDSHCKVYGYNSYVGIRSSAVMEDGKTSSFAGTLKSIMLQRGIKNVLKAIHQCMASGFDEECVDYFFENNFDFKDLSIAVIVQAMCRSDLGSSGVMMSIDTESGFRDEIIIQATNSHCELIVSGDIVPDEFIVSKSMLKKGGNLSPIIKKTLGSKKLKMVLVDNNGNSRYKTVKSNDVERNSFSLTDRQILQAAKRLVAIEDGFTQEYGEYTPADSEFAYGEDPNVLNIIQKRPVTTFAQDEVVTTIKSYVFDNQDTKKVLSKGASVGKKIASGKVFLTTKQNRGQFPAGYALVAKHTTPDMVSTMRKASLVITEEGGRTCHAAIVAREYGIPTIVGVANATKLLANDQVITINCAQGPTGLVYEGEHKFSVSEKFVGDMPKTKTQILGIIGDPGVASDARQYPIQGIGLGRMELVINTIGIHPNALINYQSLDLKLQRKIDLMTLGYTNKKQFFVDKLAEAIATIANAFYPRQVTIRLSDLKTNEYRELLGGYLYEPVEENPMLGFRGCSRYTSESYAEAFQLECMAFKKAIDMGFNNIVPMLPFVRTIEEAKQTLSIMSEYGLTRGKNGLKVYMMLEVPSNYILLEEFLELFDGGSIGSNDTTQTFLGCDRDSSLVSHIYDEMNPAVLKVIEKAIKTAKKMRKYIGICGQGPSDNPDFCKFLVKLGIDSISLNIDSVIETTLQVAKYEAAN
jgi:pyruvate, water dikinase